MNFDHTHDLDLDLEVSRLGGPIDIKRKRCELIVHDIDFFVTMVGWVDVPDNGRGDFKRRRAGALSIFRGIVISSWAVINVFIYIW